MQGKLSRSQAKRSKSGRKRIKGNFLPTMGKRQKYRGMRYLKCNERREGMRKQKIIMSSMVHIVCISEGKYYDFDLDVDEPLTPEIMHKIRPMLREAVDSDDITVLTWQRYEMSL